MAAVRQSNMELCRIASILLVMLVHTTFQSLGWDNPSFGVLFLAAFSIIGVNVFVLLTGYFSVSPKKTSLANLFFICLFWMSIKIVCCMAFNQPLDYKYLFFVTNSNWFIPSYIGLLFLAPILNVFCNSVSNKVLFWVVIALLSIEIWFDFLPPYPKVRLGTQGGYSVLSFAILYLIARYIKLYGVPKGIRKYGPLFYLSCSFVLAAIAYIFLKHGYNETRLLYSYNNPIIILSSVAFLMSFEQLKIGQSKFINHIAKSTLAVLLGHTAIFFIYTKQFKYLYDSFSSIQVMGYWALAIVIVFCASIAIDQIRILLYKPIEKLINKTIKNNELLPVEIP